jgi:L-threonylcarbamoyladenylate synthase
MTERLTIDPQSINAEAIARAADVLRRGGLVAFPTETVSGLGANALDANAVARIFTAKGRPSNNPLIVHIAEIEQVSLLTTGRPTAFFSLTAAFWPGPLTLVLPKSANVPDIVTGGGSTVAVRMPAHPVALALLREVNLPLAAPSANRSSELSPTCADHVLRGLDGRIDLLLDAGPTTAGIESTVLDLTTTPPRLLRLGPITPGQIEAIIGPIGHIGPIPTLDSDEKTPLASPGMLPRHYAPRTPLECAAAERVRELVHEGNRVGWVTWSATPETNAATHVMPANAVEYAAKLYAVLHELDMLGLDRIIVETLPNGDDWLAIQDRLRRASYCRPQGINDD